VSNPSPYAAFQYSGFRFFITGNFLATIGRQMLSVCVGWEVYRRTGSAFALGLIGLTGALPIITLAIPAGHLADRFSRRSILMIAQLVAACTSISLALVSYGRADIRWIFVLLFLAGSARTFGWAARGAFMANLVPQADFNNAVTWNSSTFGVASAIGPALAGLALVHHPYWVVYAMDATCSFCFFLFLIGAHGSQEKAAARASGFEGLFDGLRFVWAICMALTLAHSPPMRRPGVALMIAVTGFGLATIVFGLSRSFTLSLAMLFLTGVFDNVSVVVRNTLVQLLTPDSMRGRVSAVNNVFIGSSNEVGAFESGVTAAWFGPILSVVGGGIATILTVFTVALIWRQVLALGPFASLKPDAGIAGPPPKIS